MSDHLDKPKMAQYWTIFICVVWAGWIIVEYTSYHTYLTHALIAPELGHLLHVLAALAMGAGGYLFHKILRKRGEWSISYRGIYLYLIVSLLAMIVIAIFCADHRILQEDTTQRLGYFFCFSSLMALALVSIFTSAHNLGHVFLKPYKSIYKNTHTVISIAMGISILTLILFILGLFSLLQPIIVGVIFIAILLVWYKNSWKFVHGLLISKHEFTLRHWWMVPTLFALFSTLAIAWIGSLKAYSIGFDGASLYMNTTRLIAESQSLPIGGQAYNWSIFMSLGQVLFSSETVSILLSHSMGLVSLFVIFPISRLCLDRDYAFLATTLSFIAPYYCFHAMIDEKIDLGFLFIALSCLLLVLEAWLTTNKKQVLYLDSPKFANISWISHSDYIWILTGWLCGFAFGIKYTAFFLFIAVVSLLFYRELSKKGFISAFVFCLGTLFLFQIYRFSKFDISPRWAIILGTVFILFGLTSLYYFFRANLKNIKKPIVHLFLFAFAFILAFMPWVAKNLTEHDHVKAQYFIKGNKQRPDLKIDSKYTSKQLGHLNTPPSFRVSDQRIAQSYFISDDQQPNGKSLNNESSGRKISQTRHEELKRYIGYEKGIWPYLSLPYDLTMNTNIPNQRYLDIGFIFLLFLPLLLLSTGSSPRSTINNLLIFIGLIIWLSFSYLSVYFRFIPTFSASDALQQRSNFFSEHVGGNESIFYSIHAILITPILKISEILQGAYTMGDHIKGPLVVLALLALSVGVYQLLRARISSWSPAMKYVLSFTFVYLFLWILMGNGVIWYGFPIWVLLPIVILYYFNHPTKFLGVSLQRFSSIFYGIILSIAMVYSVSVYFTNPRGGGKSAALFSWPFIDYITKSTTNKNDVLKYYNVSYPQALSILNKDRSNKIYQINTFLGYHIDNNDTRVYNDSNLGQFAQITKVVAYDEFFIDVLKDNHFNYILYDLKTPTIDKTAEQTLVQKSNRLLEVLTRSKKVKLVSSDNYVDNPSGPIITLPNGQKARVKPGLVGNTVKRGSFVLYKIL